MYLFEPMVVERMVLEHIVLERMVLEHIVLERMVLELMVQGVWFRAYESEYRI